jgi:ACS family tartrate transporter-like MFS transporter
MSQAQAPVLDYSSGEASEAAVVAKVMRRLIPFMCFLYFLNYIDRVNIQFAKLEMNRALGLNDAQYGLAAGIFFVGYCLFEIPSNLILGKVGARRWIARIMISWGLVSAAMCLMTGAKSFYALRLLLGVAEAGFFPGMVIYLAAWVPAHARARALAWFLTSTALAGVVGSPLAGLLLQVEGLGLAGWQWLFLIEGAATVIFGVVTWFVLIDKPADARWLSAEEKALLDRRMRAENAVEGHHVHRLGAAMRSPMVWLMSAYYCLVIFGFYAVNYWTASVIREVTRGSTLRIGVLSAIPFVAATIGMVIAGIVSDRTGWRRGVIAVCTACGCVGTFFVVRTDSTALRIAYLSLAAAGIWGTLGPFWALPQVFLRGTAAAAGVALINSVGNLLGGFIGPTVIGYLKEGSKDFRSGFLLTSIVLAAGLALTPFLRPRGSGR